MQASANLYELLDVHQGCSFKELKRAYYRRAKQCHPDHHPNNSTKEEEFKRLVDAFDVLSDAVRRKAYDEHLKLANNVAVNFNKAALYSDQRSVMDSIADDILEELIVGNNVPVNATLQTLMRDLEHTENFLRFREAKYYYHHKRFREALPLFKRAAAICPNNILYQFYLGECLAAQRKFGAARKAYKRCLRIGDNRFPPQRLQRVRRRIERLHSQRGVFGKVFSWFLPPEPVDTEFSDQKMIDDMSRSMTRLLSESKKKDSDDKPPKLLGQ